MKSLKKKIAVVLVLAMAAVTMIVPAFAANPTTNGSITFSVDNTPPGPVAPEDLPDELKEQFKNFNSNALDFPASKISLKTETYLSADATGSKYVSFLAQSVDPAVAWEVKVSRTDFVNGGNTLTGATLTLAPTSTPVAPLNSAGTAVNPITLAVTSTPTKILSGGFGVTGANWAGTLVVPKVPAEGTYTSTITWAFSVNP